MNILVIVSHPDDEILGMGGTILKHSQKGDKIKIIFLATGITSRRKSNYTNSSSYEKIDSEYDKMSKEIKKLRNHAKKACQLVGVKNLMFYDFPDNEMDSVSLLEVIKTIENEIQIFKPDIVYTHHFDDLNIDHKITFNATLTASRPYESSIKELICFEVPSSTEWNYPATFNPNYFVNIEKQLKNKIKAMKAYANESGNFPHPRSSKSLIAIAEKWGTTSGIKSAEAFEIIRKIDRS
jgi:LmbE family N-acetylglucosaminyl deacetylase|tara:strand:+ start:1630 stop:2343 length:714 start_codon:yes stop_codon:yes gene_type:complete